MRGSEPVSALPEKVLLATDGSEEATLAARAASGLCAKTGAELHVVHAWRLPAATPHARAIISSSGPRITWILSTHHVAPPSS